MRSEYEEFGDFITTSWNWYCITHCHARNCVWDEARPYADYDVPRDIFIP